MSSQIVQLGEGISASRMAVPQQGPSSNPGSDLSFAEHLDRAVRPESAAGTEARSEGFKTQVPAPRIGGNPGQSETRPEASSSEGRAPQATSAPVDRSSQPQPQRQAPGTSDAKAPQTAATRNPTPPQIVSTRTATSSPARPQDAQAAVKNSAVASESSSHAPSASQAAEAARASLSTPDSEILAAALPLLQVPQNPVQATVVQPASARETNCANTNVALQPGASDSPAVPASASVAVPVSANAQGSANTQPADQPAERTPAVARGVTSNSQASADAQLANPSPAAPAALEAALSFPASAEAPQLADPALCVASQDTSSSQASAGAQPVNQAPSAPEATLSFPASVEPPQLADPALRVAPQDTSSFQASADVQAANQARSAAPDAKGAHDEAPGELTQHEKPADSTAAVQAAPAEKASDRPALELPPGLNATTSKVFGDPATTPAPDASQAADAVDTLASRHAATAASPQASPGLVATGTASTSADSSSQGPDLASTSAAPVSAASSDSSPDSGDGSQGSNSNSSGQDSNRVQLPAPSPAFSIDAGSAVALTDVHAAASVVLPSNTGADGAAARDSATPLQNANFVSQERAFAAWQSTTEQLGRIVSAATLNSAQNGMEMRVQFRTADFGPMELLATLEAGKVGAAISVEDSEAHNALLHQLPALQQSLAERQVQLDHISVVSSFGQGGTGLGTSSRRHHDDPTPSREYPQQLWESEQQASEPVYAPATETWLPESSWGRLNVRA